ncbi:hypothetical protein IFR05_016450, partial [Cadophora sp. M221]
YGDITYTKIDFLNAYEGIRKKTFVPRTILSAWRKAGLSPFKPQVVYDKMTIFQQSEGSTRLAPVETERPVMLKPFQQPPKTPERATHLAYLDRRLADAEGPDNDLTPSFYRSWRAYQDSTEPKILKSGLIIEREQARILALKEDTRRKEGSNSWVQHHGSY